MLCFDEWSNCILSNCGHYYSIPRKRGRAQAGDFRLRTRHGVDIAEMECRIDRIERIRAGIRRDDSEYMFLLLQKSGQMGVRHNGREAVLDPGDCLLMDSTRTAELRFDGRMASFMSVHLPRSLCLEKGAAASMTGRRVGRNHPLHASLINLLDAGGSDAPGTISADYLFDFVTLMFRFDVPATDGGLFRDRQGRFQFICDTAERHLCEADFSIERLASLVHMSRRQLQRDFSDNGMTFTRFILGRRIRLVADHLRRTTRLGQRPAISEAAYRAGFNDLSYFNRVFRQEYGMSPRAYCADCTDCADDPHLH